MNLETLAQLNILWNNYTLDILCMKPPLGRVKMCFYTRLSDLLPPSLLKWELFVYKASHLDLIFSSLIQMLSLVVVMSIVRAMVMVMVWGLDLIISRPRVYSWAQSHIVK